MKRLRGLCLSLAGLMLMTTPALAADYNFETPAPKDFYGSTSYEEVYGAQYNYGGTNAVDFLDPLADSAPGISINSGSSLEYGINSGSGSIYPDSSGSSYPIQWGDVPTLPATQFTAVSEVERNDGSIGTLVIPSLGIRYKAYDGTDSASMRKGVGHFHQSQLPLPQHKRLGGKHRSVRTQPGLQPQHRRNQGSGNWRYHSVSDQPGDKDLCGEFGQDHRLD